MVIFFIGNGLTVEIITFKIFYYVINIKRATYLNIMGFFLRITSKKTKKKVNKMKYEDTLKINKGTLYTSLPTKSARSHDLKKGDDVIVTIKKKVGGNKK